MDGHRPKLGSTCEQELLWALARLISISSDFLFETRKEHIIFHCHVKSIVLCLGLCSVNRDAKNVVIFIIFGTFFKVFSFLK